ncbi:MAG TPA: sarcosine oxidase subunit gamma family protein [Dongiaceae bacterium]|jgi:sarcosine oxidase subunit gamma|nr:sarcosine oxidase subunit gamma family protein [Dongiaceae bacterium]
MAELYQRRSALAHLALALRQEPRPETGIRLLEGPRRIILAMRGEGVSFGEAVRGATGLALPAANRVMRGGERYLFWMGPNEYWLIAAEAERDVLQASLTGAFAPLFAAVTDISESRTLMVLTGARAREVLARGISLDLDPRRFAVDDCAQTSFARVNVLLHRMAGEEFHLTVLNSYADYLWRLLERIIAILP